MIKLKLTNTRFLIVLLALILGGAGFVYGATRLSGNTTTGHVVSPSVTPQPSVAQSGAGGQSQGKGTAQPTAAPSSSPLAKSKPSTTPTPAPTAAPSRLLTSVSMSSPVADEIGSSPLANTCKYSFSGSAHGDGTGTVSFQWQIADQDPPRYTQDRNGITYQGVSYSNAEPGSFTFTYPNGLAVQIGSYSGSNWNAYPILNSGYTYYLTLIAKSGSQQWASPATKFTVPQSC